MKKIILVLVAVFMVSTFGGIAFAKLTIDIDATGYDISTLTNMIEDKWKDPVNFSNGVGNAVVYSGQVAGLSGYQNYDLFALMFGGNFSVQLPNNPLEGIDISDVIAEGDVYAGAASSLALNLGLNLSIIPFIDLDGFYGNIKFGSFTTPEANGIISEAFNFGLGVQYGIVADKSLLFGLLKWRGVSVGSGFNIISSNTTISGIEFAYSSGDTASDLAVDSTIQAVIDSTVFSIPLEVNTSARLFWILNFNAGLGVDLSVGSSELSMVGESIISNGDGTDLDAGTVTITGTTDEGPSFVRPRVTAGVGICAGPWAIIDVNTTYYFMSGFSLNVSTGIVW